MGVCRTALEADGGDEEELKELERRKAIETEKPRAPREISGRR